MATDQITTGQLLCYIPQQEMNLSMKLFVGEYPQGTIS